MMLGPPSATRTDTRFPFRALFRSDGGLARMRVEVDLAHRDADTAAGLRRDVDLAAATDRAGGDTDGGWGFELRVDVGHVQSRHFLSERERISDRKSKRLNSSH